LSFPTEDTSSLLPFEEVLDLAKRSETAIYAIGLRSNDANESRIQGGRVRAAAVRAGNGWPGLLPEPAARSAKVYGDISDELSSRCGRLHAAIRATADGAGSSSASTAVS
jgi:hypothetical protein